MLIGQQIIIQSTQNCYKVYRGRLGVVVDYNEIENYYLVWSNGTTIRLGEAEMSPLEGPKEEVAVKFEVEETAEKIKESHSNQMNENSLEDTTTKCNEEYGAEFVKENTIPVGEAEVPQAPVKKRGRPAKVKLTVEEMTTEVNNLPEMND